MKNKYLKCEYSSYHVYLNESDLYKRIMIGYLILSVALLYFCFSILQRPRGKPIPSVFSPPAHERLNFIEKHLDTIKPLAYDRLSNGYNG